MGEVMFTGMDIPKEVRKLLDTHEAKICKYMTEDEKKAYKYGLDTFQGMLQTICDDEEPVIHIEGQSIEEMTLSEVKEKLGIKLVRDL